MSSLQLRPAMLTIVAIAIGVLIVLIETVLQDGSNGNLLLVLAFWSALIQGPVAVVAAAEISLGKWIKPMKKELLTFYPLILFIAILFIFLYFKIDIYKWTEIDHQWLSKNFFILRNSILLLLSFILAHFYVRASLKGKSERGTLAVLFILSFVLTQSLVAYDWIMSLDYPWISTMFGPIFFLESFYAGLAISAIIAAFKLLKNNSEDIRKVMRDSALFMFGIALAWAGLFYGQYLVIWYGNIPWETNYFSVRMSHSPFREMMYLVIFILFIFPFIGLVSRKSKFSRVWVLIVSFSILGGLLIERLFYILPVIPLNGLWLVIEFILMTVLMIIFYRSRKEILKYSE
ncbi:MAG: hypothetical protein EH225_06360 [Calditrichaeota bacterium]|nr:hypothetical protein [Calditrichota bacterium]RQV93088.1 MAG: hypothetical protein EH221_10320 [bacterium]RQW04001.1 MAG: hypothetical protein EH225_06360 [Calditrichota bacterium]